MEPATWWKSAVIYQIYPRSFADTNGDGVGDLRGIRAPTRPPAAGSASMPSGCRRSTGRRWPTRLRRRATTATSTRSSARSTTSTGCWPTPTRAGCGSIIDWVPNHTSDQHPWFSSRRVVQGRPEARLVHLARPGSRRRSAQQLDRALRTPAWTSTRPRASTTCTFPARAARPQLAPTPRSRRRCTTRCGSGSTAASTGSAWT